MIKNLLVSKVTLNVTLASILIYPLYVLIFAPDILSINAFFILSVFSLVILWPVGLTLLKSNHNRLISIRPNYLCVCLANTCTSIAISLGIGTNILIIDFVMYAIMVFLNYVLVHIIKKTVSLKQQIITIEDHAKSRTK